MISPETSVIGLFKGTEQDLINQFKMHPLHRGETTDLPRAVRLAPFYIKYGKMFNIRADIAWPQMEHETGCLTFLGDVSPEQNNFAGIGATGGVPGNSFATEELGVIAQYAHLAWYVFGNHVNEYCNMNYDPRHWKWGGQPHRDAGYKLIDLAGKWAVPGDYYAQAICHYANEIKIEGEPEPPIPVDYQIIIQMGHIGRTSGYTGTAGEQAFTEELGKEIDLRLKNSGINYRLMGADNWLSPEPNTCEVFFSLHADGSLKSWARGFSIGYPETNDRLFSEMMAQSYKILTGFTRRSDNYTLGLTRYYAWRNNHVVAKHYCLLEHGFMTNPIEREWMTSNISIIAEHHATIIKRFFS